MLVDGAKCGDVEIPVFCYEPKLGQPVGACRMCLVEIEGIPKLQTACSTPVKDGMVVHTQTDRVKGAQEAVVEFLLVNHPLDCPVCDKGGECPLQDISFGWGGGQLALHRAQAPLHQAARALAADRDRPRALHPLLPLRALLPGGRRGLPARPARARRALLRRHVRRPPVRGAVQREHHRAVPRRGADLAALPLPRAAVGHRAVGLGLHAVPVAVQRLLHRARRPRPARACPGRTTTSTTAGCATRAASPTSHVHADDRITEPLLRDGGELRPVTWERALEAAGALTRHKGRVGAARRRRHDQRGGLPPRSACMREGLDSPHLDSRARAAPLPLGLARALAAPGAPGATVPDLEYAHTVLVLDCEPVDDAPILDLRIRKGVRRRGVKLAVATSRPSSLDAERRRASPASPPAARGAFVQALSRRDRRPRARRPVRRRRRRPEARPRHRRACSPTSARTSSSSGASAWPPTPTRLRALLNLSARAQARGRRRRRPARAPGRAPTAAACARWAACPRPGPGYAELAGEDRGRAARRSPPRPPRAS